MLDLIWEQLERQLALGELRYPLLEKARLRRERALDACDQEIKNVFA